MNTQPITLQPGQHWSPRDAWFRRRKLTLRCYGGTLWITGRGVAGDHLLRAGDSLTVHDARGLLVAAVATGAAVTAATFDVTGTGLLPGMPERQLPENACPVG